MATYRSLAEREAAEGAEQQRIQQMQTQPADPTFAGAVPPAPATAPMNPDPAAPPPVAPAPGTSSPFAGQGSTSPGNAPPWLSQQQPGTQGSRPPSNLPWLNQGKPAGQTLDSFNGPASRPAPGFSQQTPDSTPMRGGGYGIDPGIGPGGYQSDDGGYGIAPGTMENSMDGSAVPTFSRQPGPGSGLQRGTRPMQVPQNQPVMMEDGGGMGIAPGQMENYRDAGMHGDSMGSMMGPQGRPMQQPMQPGTSGPNDPRMAASQGPNPGTQIGEQQAWDGGPNVTMTRSGAEGLPDVATGLNTNGLPQLATGLNTQGFAGIDQDFAGASQRGADAAYGAASQYFDEDFGRDRASLENQLVNQGLTPGSEAFNTQMSLMQRGQNQARTGAALQAQGVGHQQSGDLLMRALQTRQQQAAEAGQGANTALAARGALSGEQGQSAGIGLAARGLLGGERERDSDRLHQQSMDVAGLGLGARGQSLGRDTALQSNATAASAAANAANNARYGIDTSRDLSLRGLGLQQDNMDFTQLMSLINASRGGVNMPNFGPAAPLDVGGAYQIASGNNNAEQNRNAADRGALANLGGAAINGILRNTNGY